MQTSSSPSESRESQTPPPSPPATPTNQDSDDLLFDPPPPPDNTSSPVHASVRSVGDSSGRAISDDTSSESSDQKPLVLPSDGPFVSFESLGPPPPPDTSGAGQKEARRSSPMNDLFRFRTAKDNVLLACGILAAVSQGLLPPLNMIIFGNILNFVGTSLDRDSFYRMIYIMAGFAGIGLVLGFVNVFCFELLADRQVKKLKEENLRALMRQEIGYFDLHDLGTLSAKINNNCVQVRDGLGMKFGQCFQFGAQFLGGYIVGFTKGWKMTLLLSVALPILAGSVAALTVIMRKQVEKSKKAFEKAGSTAEETFSSIRTVMAFSGESKSEETFNRGIEQSLANDVGAAKYKALGLSVIFGSVFLTYALGWWFGGKEVERGTLDAGSTVTVFFCIMIASFSLGQLMPNVNTLIVGSKAASDILLLIDRDSHINPEMEDGMKNVEVRGKVEFKNVKFYYPARPEKPVFSNLNLTIPAGKSVALVGSSGCGKSTIIQLVERFYDADSGSILIDDVPVKDYNLRWIREQMALVSQEPRLFSQSIHANIAYGKPNATEEEVIEAAKNANAHGFISQFPDKYQTDAGEGGSMLSGGQKQRISIARAMLRSPAILILDEATSALDNESEKVVQKALDTIISHRQATTIIVAHRLTTVRNADLIIVLDNADGMGSVVVEQGTHDELVALDNGLYRQLVEAQTLQGAAALSPKAAELQRDATAASLAKSLDLPAEAARQLSRAESVVKLMKKYSTKASLKSLTKLNKKKEKKPKVNLKRLYGYNRDQWVPTTLGALCASITGCTWPAVAVLIASFIALFADPGDKDISDEASKLALYFVLIAFVSAGTAFGQHYFFGVSGERLVSKMRRMVFHSAIHQDMAFFDEPKNNTGYLSSVISADCAIIRGVLGDNLMIIVQNAVTLVCAAVIAFVCNAELAAVALVAFILVVPATVMQNFLLRKTSTEDDLTDTSTPGFVMNEVITGLRTVAAYNLQTTMGERYSDSLATTFKDDVKAAYITGFFAGLAAGLIFAANSISLWYGGNMVFKGEITFKDEMMVIMVLLMAGTGIGRSTSFVTDSKKSKEACGNIFAILDRNPAISVLDQTGSELTVQGNIKSDGINFRYPLRPEVPVYQNLSFEVSQGQTVALVGESGCGKSTFIQLLERFYDVSEPIGGGKSSGGIMVDGNDIRDFRLSHLRQQLGLVSQEPVLFDGTIEDNIRYSRPDASQAEVINAAKMANAHSFIERFPDGYATGVGKGGSQLSGGQKQRIAIARALVREPKILLLDEATSALDAESEKIVQAALDELLAHSERTTIVIAHRLSTVRNANRIVVLTNEDKCGSKVIEVGTHEELMQIELGVYRKLIEIANH